MGQEFAEEWVLEKKSSFMYGARIFRRVGSGQKVNIDVRSKKFSRVGSGQKVILDVRSKNMF